MKQFAVVLALLVLAALVLSLWSIGDRDLFEPEPERSVPDTPR